MSFKERFLAEQNDKQRRAENKAATEKLEKDRLRAVRSSNYARLEEEATRQKTKFLEFLKSTPIPNLVNDAKDVVQARLEEKTWGGINMPDYTYQADGGELIINKFSQQYSLEWSSDHNYRISINLQEDGLVTFKFGGREDCYDDNHQEKKTINYKSWSQNPNLLDDALFYAIKHPSMRYQHEPSTYAW